MTKMISRAPLLLRLRHGRRRDEGDEVVGRADALAEQADRGRLGGGRAPGELEVAVGRHRAIGEADRARVGGDRVDLTAW